MGATTNLVVNPSWETGTSNWTAYSLTSYTRITTISVYGTYCAYITDTVSGSDESLLSDFITVAAGTIYTLSAHISKVVTASQTYTGAMEIAWYTAASAYISSDAIILTPGNFGWLRFTLTAPAPATAAKAKIKFSDSGIVSGDWYLWIDGVQFEAQPAATAYCDGDQPGCAWSGTAHASTSSRAAEAAYTTITIADGTTTLTLTDGRNYALVDAGWAPNVASLRQSTIGGSGPYNDVEEQLTLNVLGETGVEVLFNLAELSRMLDQAERWSRGEPVSAVKLTYQPQGSVLTAALSCVILGRAGQMAVSTPASFNDLLMCYEIANVQLSFRRRGLWLEAVEALSATGAVTNPGVATATFASSAAVASPAKAIITFPSDASVTQYVLLWANHASRIAIVEAEGMAGYQFTEETDTAKIARGGKVLRYTPTDLLSTSAGWVALTTLTTCRRMAIFAAVRNNSGSATWNVRARLTSGTSNPTYYGPDVLIDASSTSPRIVFLGLITMPTYPSYINVYAQASTITGPPTLDIDYFVALDITDEMAGAISASLSGSGSSGTIITVDAQPLTSPAPKITKTVSAGVAEMSYLGDAFMAVNGTYLALAYLATDGTYWCSYTTATADTFTLTASRWKAHTTPE